MPAIKRSGRPTLQRSGRPDASLGGHLNGPDVGGLGRLDGRGAKRPKGSHARGLDGWPSKAIGPAEAIGAGQGRGPRFRFGIATTHRPGLAYEAQLVPATGPPSFTDRFVRACPGVDAKGLGGVHLGPYLPQPHAARGPPSSALGAELGGFIAWRRTPTHDDSVTTLQPRGPLLGLELLSRHHGRLTGLPMPGGHTLGLGRRGQGDLHNPRLALPDGNLRGEEPAASPPESMREAGIFNTGHDGIARPAQQLGQLADG